VKQTEESFEQALARVEAGRLARECEVNWSAAPEGSFRYNVDSMVNWLRNHPASSLFREGGATTVSCNNPIKYVAVMSQVFSERVTYKGFIYK
jgi:hypothetical protein